MLKHNNDLYRSRGVINHWFYIFGVPRQIHSDQGRSFESMLIQQLQYMDGIVKTRTTLYRPQGNNCTSIYGLFPSHVDVWTEAAITNRFFAGAGRFEDWKCW